MDDDEPPLQITLQEAERLLLEKATWRRRMFAKIRHGTYATLIAGSPVIIIGGIWLVRHYHGEEGLKTLGGYMAKGLLGLIALCAAAFAIYWLCAWWKSVYDHFQRKAEQW